MGQKAFEILTKIFQLFIRVYGGHFLITGTESGGESVSPLLFKIIYPILNLMLFLQEFCGTINNVGILQKEGHTEWTGK